MKNLYKGIGITFLIAGITLFFIGLFYQIPRRTIPDYYHEYVGGDAYNIMIEASIRGGEIAGATAAKAIYLCFGALFAITGNALLMIHKAKKFDDFIHQEIANCHTNKASSTTAESPSTAANTNHSSSTNFTVQQIK